MKNRNKPVTKHIIILVLAILAYTYYYGSTTPDLHAWFNAVALPTISAAIKIVIICYVIYIVGVVLENLVRNGKKINDKNRAVANLLASFIKYLVALINIVIILGAFGIDTTAIVASASVLTLVVGLGAQSIVGDIIAGTFMVFERTVNIGDIVLIDDFKGSVMDIGIRTTRIKDVSGDIKVISNSNIRTFVNKSKDNSIAAVTLCIEYDQNLGIVENLIESNKDRIKQECPYILDLPTYLGVQELANSSVNLLIIASCDEIRKNQSQRDLLRAYKVLFDENGINIPYPQITLSNRE